MRNCPASPSTGNPCDNSKALGVEKRKLTVSKKVMIAPRLPMKETLAESGRSPISKATMISIVPIKLETPWHLLQSNEPALLNNYLQTVYKGEMDSRY
jgi:hypothetical protein